MDASGQENGRILWSGKCSWPRVIAWRWKEAAALAFLACALTGLAPVMDAVDGVGSGIARTWFGWTAWREAASGHAAFVAMLLAAGWFAGQVLGSLMTHSGRKFSVTSDRIVWGNRGEAFSAPLSSLASMQEGSAADGRTVKLTFSDGRKDILIAGVPDAAGAARAIRRARESS